MPPPMPLTRLLQLVALGIKQQLQKIVRQQQCPALASDDQEFQGDTIDSASHYLTAVALQCCCYQYSNGVFFSSHL